MSATYFLLICLVYFFRIDAISVPNVQCQINNDHRNIVTKNLSSTIKKTCPEGTTGVTIEGDGSSTISNNFFTGIEALRSFKMERVNFEVTEPETFKNLSKIDFLVLRRTNLSVIKSRAFINLSNLNLLDLSENKLTEINKGVFEDITTVDLDLSKNRISKIEVGAFSGVSLKNKIFRLRFNLVNNKLQEFNPEVFTHPLLSSLMLRRNEISVLRPSVSENLPHLSYLSLSENKIKTIPEDVFNGSSIGYLDLAKNEIETITSKAFDDMSNLERIYLDHNKLTTWNADWFHGSNKILHVYVTHNFIVNIPDEAFKNLIWSYVTFEYNQIKTISTDAFKGSNLTSLTLSNNKLEKLNLKKGVKISEELNLSNNTISCSEEKRIRAAAKHVFLDCY